MKGLDGVSEAKLQECAEKLGVDLASVKAVAQVESSKGAFIADGKPPILFEGHWFWKRLEANHKNPKDYVKGNEDILYPKWTEETRKNYKGGLKEYDRLERAKKIDEKAALESASWGMFQIMGVNHQLCGVSTVQEFVNRMCTSADEQVDLFTEFILRDSNKLTALRKKDWATFAYYYNGSGYRDNNYDTKLAAAYQANGGNNGTYSA